MQHMPADQNPHRNLNITRPLYTGVPYLTRTEAAYLAEFSGGKHYVLTQENINLNSVLGLRLYKEYEDYIAGDLVYKTTRGGVSCYSHCTRSQQQHIKAM